MKPIVQDETDCGIASVNPYRYRGYYYDAEIGMYYLQSRYYDPENGRFINADNSKYLMIDIKNLFAYCSNEPVGSADYLGCCGMTMENPLENPNDYAQITGVSVDAEVEGWLFWGWDMFWALLRIVAKWFYSPNKNNKSSVEMAQGNLQWENFKVQWLNENFPASAQKLLTWYNSNWTFVKNTIDLTVNCNSLALSTTDMKSTTMDYAPAPIETLITIAMDMLDSAKREGII